MRACLISFMLQVILLGFYFFKPFLLASIFVLSYFNFKIWVDVLSNPVLCGGVKEVRSLNGYSSFLALDEDSWSDGEQEPITVDQTWRGDPDSEADSIDSDQEDPLK